MRLFRSFLLISALYLSACQTGGALIEETPAGVSEIKRVLIQVMGNVKSSGRSGKEMVFGFHDRELKLIENPDEVRERYFPVVTILGDRRPFDIRIQAYVEKRTQYGFENLGQSDAMAEVWAQKVRETLYEGRDKRNVIDDFKAF